MMSYFSKILILTCFMQFQSVLSLVVVKSLEPLETPDPYWGLKLIPESVDTRNVSFIKGITFCGRFYFHRFPRDHSYITSSHFWDFGPPSLPTSAFF